MQGRLPAELKKGGAWIFSSLFFTVAITLGFGAVVFGGFLFLTASDLGTPSMGFSLLYFAIFGSAYYALVKGAFRRAPGVDQTPDGQSPHSFWIAAAWLLTSLLFVVSVIMALNFFVPIGFLYFLGEGHTKAPLYINMLFLLFLSGAFYLLIKIPSMPALSFCRARRYKAAIIYVLCVFIYGGLSFGVYVYGFYLKGQAENLRPVSQTENISVPKPLDPEDEKRRINRERQNRLIGEAGQHIKNFVFMFSNDDPACRKLSVPLKEGKKELITRNGIQGGLLETSTSYELYWPDGEGNCLMLGINPSAPDQKKEDLMKLFDEMVPVEENGK